MHAKDRKPTKPELKALEETEHLVGKVASIVYDETKIPKRKRVIGERMLNSSISAYEKIRAANKIPLLKNEELTKQRIDISSSAEMDMMNVSSDIKLLPTVVSNLKGTEPWLIEVRSVAVACKNITNKWVRSDMSRAEKYYTRQEEKSSDPVLVECVQIVR